MNQIQQGECLLPCDCHKINEFGEVFSLLIQSSIKGTRGVVTRIGDSWKKLNPCKTASGYLQISIHGKSVRVNRLIALHMIPNSNNWPEVQHINGIRIDNRKENLKWGNQKENAKDREKHGNSIHGSKSPNSKLNDEKVRLIRILRQKTTLEKLANQFNVSKKLILLIVQGKIWRHV